MGGRLMAAGIDTRHSKNCRSRDGGRCNCEPTYQAHVYDSRAGKRIRKSFPTYAAARGWRQDAVVALRNGATFAARPATRTLREEAEEWLTGVEEDRIANRSGQRYKPSAVLRA